METTLWFSDVRDFISGYLSSNVTSMQVIRIYAAPNGGLLFQLRGSAMDYYYLGRSISYKKWMRSVGIIK